MQKKVNKSENNYAHFYSEAFRQHIDINYFITHFAQVLMICFAGYWKYGFTKSYKFKIIIRDYVLYNVVFVVTIFICDWLSKYLYRSLVYHEICVTKGSQNVFSILFILLFLFMELFFPILFSYSYIMPL